MEGNKFAEFVTVLLTASLAGIAIWGSLVYLEGTARAVALFVLVGLVIITWQLLRKHFGRRR